MPAAASVDNILKEICCNTPKTAGGAIDVWAIFTAMTRTSHFRHFPIDRERFLAAIGLLALLCVQVSIASHQFEHTSEDIAKSCRICVQQDKADDVPLHQVVEYASFGAGASISVFELTENGIARLSSYNARAPPLS